MKLTITLTQLMDEFGELLVHAQRLAQERRLKMTVNRVPLERNLAGYLLDELSC